MEGHLLHGEQTANGGERTADSGKRTADSGQRTAKGDERTMDGGWKDVSLTVSRRGTAIGGTYRHREMQEASSAVQHKTTRKERAFAFLTKRQSP